MNFRYILFLFLLMPVSRLFAHNQPVVVPSSLKSVTVYRSGAEMSHVSTAQLNSGSQEVLIENISNTIDINSIQINVPSAVTIMGVEFSNNHLVTPEASARIKMLQDSLQVLRRESERLTVQIRTVSELLEVLKANRDIKGQQTGLSVAELMKLMDYYKSKSTELQHEMALLQEKLKKNNEVSSRISAQIQEEQNKNTRNTGQLRLQLSVAAWGKYDFAVSYITPNAWWQPFYDIRVENTRSPLKIIYKARIGQTTGIDWKKVKLSLSTSLPSQWGNAPVLNAWFLSYINPVYAMNRTLASNTIQSMAGNVPGITMDETMEIKASRNKEGNRMMYIVNGTEMSEEDFLRISPSAIKSKKVLQGNAASSLYGSRASTGVMIIELKDGLDDYISVTENELNINFDVELPYDVPTNGKEQTALLQEHSIAAVYKYYAVPKLDKDAYLLAEVAEWEKLNLLPGQANIIFEGTYVGKSFIDPTSTMDTLNLTLGRDKRVVIKKEKMMDYSSVKFLGANKVQKITYDLVVRNNKKDTVRMLLKDQYPLTTLKEIEVELLEHSDAMVNPETGVLTWKLELKPGESRRIRFAYSVKYPKDRQINLN